MFLVLLTYQKSLEIVDQYLASHRSFLDTCYEKNYFIASGPRNPRTGGIILSQLKDEAQLKSILKEDPFVIHGIANYEIVEFSPVKYHKDFAGFV